MADAKDWERLFDQVDKNGNGYLTAGEMAKEMVRIGYPGTEGKIKGFLCAADNSGDRQISKQEFMDSMESAPVEFHIAALCQSVFSHFDKSGDGHITTSELKMALRQLGRHLTDRQMEDVMRQMDDDRSGSINLREFVEGVTKHVI